MGILLTKRQLAAWQAVPGENGDKIGLFSLNFATKQTQ